MMQEGSGSIPPPTTLNLHHEANKAAFPTVATNESKQRSTASPSSRRLQDITLSR